MPMHQLDHSTMFVCVCRSVREDLVAGRRQEDGETQNARLRANAQPDLQPADPTHTDPTYNELLASRVPLISTSARGRRRSARGRRAHLLQRALHVPVPVRARAAGVAQRQRHGQGLDISSAVHTRSTALPAARRCTRGFDASRPRARGWEGRLRNDPRAPRVEWDVDGTTSENSARSLSRSRAVMDKDRFGRNELIGRVVLGAKSGPTEVKHWNDMFAKTRQPVARWHVLRDFR